MTTLTPEKQLRLCRALWPDREFSIFGLLVGPHVRRVDGKRCDTTYLASDEAVGRMVSWLMDRRDGLRVSCDTACAYNNNGPLQGHQFSLNNWRGALARLCLEVIDDE